MDNCPITTKKRNFFEKLPYFFKFLRKYWNTPPKGKYLSYKEYFAYCIGGMGVSGGVALPAYVALSAGLYMAAALRINVNDIVLSGIISSIITILRGPIISMIMDNTNSKLGKFRPWLVWLPIPIILSFVGTVFIPAALQSRLLFCTMFFSFLFLYILYPLIR
jgi:Na+/melibiose symporter-like transporter